MSDYILEDDKNAGKKVRNDATYIKDYLIGRYGAILVLKELNIIYEKNILKKYRLKSKRLHHLIT